MSKEQGGFLQREKNLNKVFLPIVTVLQTAVAFIQFLLPHVESVV